MNIGTLIITVWISFFLSGCTGPDAADPKYFKTFEHIKTDQFITEYGLDSVSWVSNDAVVLKAKVFNEYGDLESGIYQVNMGGTYIRLINNENIGRHQYCFDGVDLYIRTEKGNVELLARPKGYRVIIEPMEKKKRTNKYSPIRCNFADRPAGKGGYIPLKKNDGFIRNIKNTESEYGFSSLLINSDGQAILELDVGGKQIVSEPRYLGYSDEYFFKKTNLIDRGCATFWWLKRRDWHVRSKELCFDEWIESTSKIANSTKVGLFVEQHTRRYPSAYLITETSRYPIESTAIRRAAVSPNGCMVAYGFGDYTTKPYTQVLKVFDACQFMKDKQIEIANTPPKKKSDRRIEQPTNYESHASKLGY